MDISNVEEDDVVSFLNIQKIKNLFQEGDEVIE